MGPLHCAAVVRKAVSSGTERFEVLLCGAPELYVC